MTSSRRAFLCPLANFMVKSLSMNQSPLICPVCRETLLLKDRTYSCNKGHSFDLAKEGYVNLLLSHQRKSKNPGDDKAMIQARRRFFDSGAFEPLSELIAKTVSSGIVLDCGCGEGHFLDALSETHLQSGSVGDVAPPLNSEPIGRASLSERAEKFFGIDVSKEAIRCAAKRYKDASWIVANGMRELPFADNSLDMILSVLAPRNIEEFARILKPDGTLTLGVPGPNHLIELRTLLNANASDFEEKADEAAAKCTPLFEEKNRKPLTYEIMLNPSQTSDLIQMTPIFWNSSPEAKAEIQQLDELTVTVSFVLLTLKQSDPVPHNPE